MTRVAALVGPTAVGKTTTAVEVAEVLGAEIISVDSMQVYRGMDIGTDKASPELLERVSHHLLDLFDPTYDVTVAEYQRLARDAIEDVAGRGRVPLLVGGSGLYLRAVVDDLSFPPRSPDVRAALENRIEQEGTGALYRELEQADPVAAGRIEPGNARRIVRALEVIAVTGRPFSDNDAWDRYESLYDLRIAGLELERSVLYERIAARVAQMIERGLVAEVGTLAERGLGATAAQALGYRQVLGSPGAGPEELTLEIVRATKRFARRQLSWFRSDPRIRWFDASDGSLIEALVGFFRGPGTVP